MKCVVCGKVLDAEECENTNEICFVCQDILEWVYSDKEYVDAKERRENLVEYLKKHRRDRNGNSQ